MNIVKQIRTKADVQTDYHEHSRFSTCPILNVKVQRFELTPDEWVNVRAELGLTADFNRAWIETHVMEPYDTNWVWGEACREGWEQAENDAACIFDQEVKLHSAGRSGGWMVVTGLPPVEEWGAILLAKFRKFARFVDATVDDHAYREAWLIGANIYTYHLEQLEALWELGAQIQNDAMMAYHGDKGWFSAERLHTIAGELC